MINNLFINASLDDSLRKYMLFKETNNVTFLKSFLVYSIALLDYIYKDNNLFVSYQNRDVEDFNSKLKCYGVDQEYIDKFYSDYQKFYATEVKNKALSEDEKNPYFNYIQEDLIEMFFAKFKFMNLNKSFLNHFRSLLVTKNNENEYFRVLSTKLTEDSDYVLNYFDKKVYEIEHDYSLLKEKENEISKDIYQTLGFSLDEINKLSDEEIDLMNTKVLNAFRLSPIEPNINEKLKKKLKKFAPNNLKSKILGIPKFLSFVTIFTIIICLAIVVGITLVR